MPHLCCVVHHSCVSRWTVRFAACLECCGVVLCCVRFCSWYWLSLHYAHRYTAPLAYTAPRVEESRLKRAGETSSAMRRAINCPLAFVTGRCKYSVWRLTAALDDSVRRREAKRLCQGVESRRQVHPDRCVQPRRRRRRQRRREAALLRARTVGCGSDI